MNNCMLTKQINEMDRLPGKHKILKLIDEQMENISKEIISNRRREQAGIRLEQNRIENPGNSLAVWWLALGAFTAGVWV